MARGIMDGDFREWEAYASTGEDGFAKSGVIVFRCRTDRSVPSRRSEFDGDHTAAERAVRTMDEGELLDRLEAAEEIS